MMKRAVVLSTFLLCAASLLATLPTSLANGSKKTAGVAVTFTKDIAPIFYKNCAECHRPGEMAPFSALSYKTVRPWAASIKEKVVSREMPPWSADPHYGKFSNDKSLSKEEIDTIVAWVDQGAKEGDRKAMPPAPKFAEGWKLGNPDMILSMPEEYTLEAKGSDEYINFTLPTTFAEDRWVQAAEIHPGNKLVVHHVVAFVQTPEMAANAKAMRTPEGLAKTIFYEDGTLIRARMDAPVYDDGCTAPNGGLARGSGIELGLPLCFYTPGKDTDIFPPGTAKQIPAGSRIVIQMHYSKTTGKVERDRTSIGLTFAKEPPQRAMMSFGALNSYFKIPAGAGNHQVTGCYTFNRDAEVYTFLPHMHVRGKDMKYEVIYPDGRRETLLSVPRYDFNWQHMYRLEKPLFMPKGTKMIVTAHFDNSAKNKYNPDPTKDVRFGDPTYDEMMIGYFDFVAKTPVRGAVKVDPAIYARYAGEYMVAPGMAFTVTKEGNKLMFTAKGFPTVEALPESETKFYFTVIDGQATFVKNDKGEVAELMLEMNGRSLRAKKVK